LTKVNNSAAGNKCHGSVPVPPGSQPPSRLEGDLSQENKIVQSEADDEDQMAELD